MKAELCKTCIHTKVCGRDKNMLGDVYVPPNPFFFSQEYRREAWERFEKRKAEGFPCDEYATDPPKTGKWLVTNRGTRCPVCGQRTFQGLTPFCAWCGAALTGIVMEDKNGETDMGTSRPER